MRQLGARVQLLLTGDKTHTEIKHHHVHTRQASFFSDINPTMKLRSAMAESNFPARQYGSSAFVESCGAVLFDLSYSRVCLSQIIDRGEWVLAKGRCNINEPRKDAAYREVHEETGYPSVLLKVRMPTRATARDDPCDVPDRARVHDGLHEPFMCTIRELPPGEGVKIIWWFIAFHVPELGDRGPGEKSFRSQWFEREEAIERLHFENDREVLRKAIEVVEVSMAE
jgi:8-oxo-dGTP pyrophosphatase MutT (NUDIX family)